MDQKLPQKNHIPPIVLRAGLFCVLVLSSTGVLLSVAWIYRRVQNSLGFAIAEVVVAFLIILIFLLILLGFGAGLGADRMVRKPRIQTLRICRSMKRCRFMRSLWGYVEPRSETDQIPSQGKHDEVEMKTLLNRPPRRGRPPTHSIDRWTKVVLAWENRDPLHNPMTLAEFLSEEFGTYADGSPRMSENSYYDWRKKVFELVRRQEDEEKKILD